MLTHFREQGCKWDLLLPAAGVQGFTGICKRLQSGAVSAHSAATLVSDSAEGWPATLVFTFSKNWVSSA